MGFSKSSDPCLQPLSVSHDSQHMVGANKPRWKKGMDDGTVWNPSVWA